MSGPIQGHPKVAAPIGAAPSQTHAALTIARPQQPPNPPPPNPVVFYLSVAVPFISMVVAVAAVLMTRRNAFITMQANILRDFQKDFEAKRLARYIASTHGKDRIVRNINELPLADIPPEIWQIFDFFDKLSMYLKRGYLDKEMVFISFFYWMYPYWCFFENDVERMKAENPLAMWDEIPRQISRLQSVGHRLGVRKGGYEKAKADIPFFFEAEALECAVSRWTSST